MTYDPLGAVIPRNLRVGDEVLRRDPSPLRWYPDVWVVVTKIEKVRDARLGTLRYVVHHTGAFGHDTFTLRPKSRVECRRPRRE